VERAGTGIDQAVDSLARWRDNIYLISQLIQNDVSSTKVCSSTSWNSLAAHIAIPDYRSVYS